MTYKFAVVIINYKTPEMTIDCVSSVLSEVHSENAVIVIVDNNSADGSIEKIEFWIRENNFQDKIFFCKSPKNSGFSGGNNIGISRVQAEYYILLNSDTIVRSNAFKVMLSTFQLDQRIGFVSPRLEDEDGTGQVSCFRFHSPLSELIKSAQTGVITKLLSNYDIPIQLTNTLSFPPWTSFACIAVRAEVIEDIGLMDESYFLYYEDTDYCRTAHERGWKVANNPDAHVVHLRGGSAELKSKAKLRQRLPQYHFESRRFYFCKFYGRIGFVYANLLWSLGRFISKARELSGNRPRGVSQFEWLDIWTKKQINISRKGKK